MAFPSGITRNNTSPEHMQLKAGQRLFNKRYELKQMLGPGGMGVVWMAFDHAGKKNVALKFLPSILVHHEKEMQSLRAQVDVGQQLRHDLIVATYGLEVEAALAAIVLEFVEGQTLKQKLEACERGFFEPDEIEPWLADITSALSYLHEQKALVHRDIKPANIIMTMEGRARLLDFGISQTLQETMGRHTQTGAVQGTSNTLAYASPESLGLGHKAAISDDIYSLGATLYELLTGTPPFYQGKPEIIGYHIKTEPVPSVMQRRAELEKDGINNTVGQPVDARWQALLEACLAKDPAQRPRTAAAALHQLSAEAPIVPRSGVRPAAERASPDIAPPSAGPGTAAGRTPLLEAQHEKKPRARLLPWAILCGTIAIAAYAIWPSPPVSEKPKEVIVVKEVPKEIIREVPVKDPETERKLLEEKQKREEAERKLADSQKPKPAPTPPALPSPRVLRAEIVEDTVTLTIQGKPKTFIVTRDPAKATKTMPYANRLDMLFVPVPGTKVLFCIHETRVKDFAAFAKATGYDATKDMYSVSKDGYKQQGDTWRSPGFTQTDDHSVCGVSAEDSDAFCKWLGSGCRLPTDHEWSLAVGGLSDEDATVDPAEKDAEIKAVYPWGAWPNTDGPPPKGAGNYAGEESKIGDEPESWMFIQGYNDGFPRTAPVCSFQPNVNGLYDLGGNVWEWTSSTWKKTDPDRVLRGGSWDDRSRGYLLSSSRFGSAPVLRGDLYGFRCVVAGRGIPSVIPEKPINSKSLGISLASQHETLNIIPIQTLETGKIGKVINIKIADSVEMSFCFCPSGEFVMGSPEAERVRGLDEGQVKVEISSDWWIGQTEVTQAQWEALMASSPRDLHKSINRNNTFYRELEQRSLGPKHPIFFVTRNDCQEFINKLNAITRIEGGWLFSLPSEAEWEYACRAGTKGAFSFGKSISVKQANFSGAYAGPQYGYDQTERGLAHSCEVAQYKPNAWGIYDMHGNVAEFCMDSWNKQLLGGVDPLFTDGPSSISRGGSWSGWGSSCRSAARWSLFSPDSERTSSNGFRVAILPSATMMKRTEAKGNSSELIGKDSQVPAVQKGESARYYR